MKAWLIYNRKDAEKNARYIQFYHEEGKKRGITFEVIYTERLEFGIHAGTWILRYDGKKMERPDFVICRTIYPFLSKQLEAMEIPVFNGSKVATICNDKALTYQYVAKLHLPMIDTIFCRKEELEEQLDRCNDNQPRVFKAVAGHGGSQVYLYDAASLDAKDQKQVILEGLKDTDFVVQPLTGKRHQDLRVYVIGNEIVAAVLRTAKEGFKSNFSLGGSVRMYELSEVEKKQVTKMIGLFEFGLVGIDFLIGDDGQLIFNEIEDVVGARMLYQCSDINLVGRYLDYIVSKLAC